MDPILSITKSQPPITLCYVIVHTHWSLNSLNLNDFRSSTHSLKGMLLIIQVIWFYLTVHVMLPNNVNIDSFYLCCSDLFPPTSIAHNIVLGINLCEEALPLTPTHLSFLGKKLNMSGIQNLRQIHQLTKMLRLISITYC